MNWTQDAIDDGLAALSRLEAKMVDSATRKASGDKVQPVDVRAALTDLVGETLAKELLNG